MAFMLVSIILPFSASSDAGGSSSVTVTIDITDVNDNRPVFANSIYYASVIENTPQGRY